MKDTQSLLGYTPTLVFKETKRNHEFWTPRPDWSDEMRHNLSAADILIVPEIADHQGQGAYFPEGTADFYRFLQDQNVSVEIAAQEEDFRELVRHFDLFIVGTFILNELLAPTFVGLVLLYLQNRVLNPAKSAIKIDLIVQKADGSAKRLNYEGPLMEFETQVKPLLEGIIEETPPALPPTPEEETL